MFGLGTYIHIFLGEVVYVGCKDLCIYFKRYATCSTFLIKHFFCTFDPFLEFLWTQALKGNK